MLVAIGNIASAQAHGNEATMPACVHLLNYAATHPDAVVRYSQSDMQLHVHSDASCLSAPNSRSRLDGLSDSKADPTRVPTPDDTPPPLNGPVRVNAYIIKVVVASATEAEFAAIVHNCQDAGKDLGHPETATPVQTTTPAQLELPTGPSSNAAPRPWMFLFTGFLTGSIKANSLSIGEKVPTTMPIISPSIICRHITVAGAHGISTRMTPPHPVCCEGVLILRSRPARFYSHSIEIWRASRYDNHISRYQQTPSESIGIMASSLATSARSDSHHHPLHLTIVDKRMQYWGS
jgi:hypothetical protein